MRIICWKHCLSMAILKQWWKRTSSSFRGSTTSSWRLPLRENALSGYITSRSTYLDVGKCKTRNTSFKPWRRSNWSFTVYWSWMCLAESFSLPALYCKLVLCGFILTGSFFQTTTIKFAFENETGFSLVLFTPWSFYSTLVVWIVHELHVFIKSDVACVFISPISPGIRVHIYYQLKNRLYFEDVICTFSRVPRYFSLKLLSSLLTCSRELCAFYSHFIACNEWSSY
jgi:hypothetical protein